MDRKMISIEPYEYIYRDFGGLVPDSPFLLHLGPAQSSSYRIACSVSRHLSLAIRRLKITDHAGDTGSHDR